MKLFISNPGSGGGATGTASITGGTATGLTSLGLRSTGAAFDLTLATSEALTAGRTLSVNVGDGNRTLTVPATGTVALLGTANSFTIGQTIAPSSAATCLTLTGGTVTTSNPLISATQTWNAVGTTFTGLALNVTNTASASGSKLLDLQFGGASKFHVLTSAASSSARTYAEVVGNGVNDFIRIGFAAATPAISFQTNLGGVKLQLLGDVSGSGGAGEVRLSSDGAVAWTNSTNGGTSDTYLTRDAANTLAQRNSTNAQTSRLYGTYTDASNYRRLAISSTTGGTFSIAPEGAGTGASGNVLHISGLPTSNPGPGILWNNAGTPAIGT